MLSVLPLYALSNGDFRTGNEEHFLQAGMTCLTAIVISANIKMFFIQSKWYTLSIALVLASILVYFASLYFITSFRPLDDIFYYLWIRLTQTGTFWLTLLLLVAIILLKDVYISGTRRNFAHRPHHIIQEMESFERLDYHTAESASTTVEDDVKMGMGLVTWPRRLSRPIEIELPSTPNQQKTQQQTGKKQGFQAV